jgi:hypothetical protein
LSQVIQGYAHGKRKIVVNFWVAVDNPDAQHLNDHKSVGCESRFFTGNAFEECDKGKSKGIVIILSSSMNGQN